MANLYRPTTTLLVNASGNYRLIVRITTLSTEKVEKVTSDQAKPAGGVMGLFYNTVAGSSDGQYEDVHDFPNPEGGRFTITTTNTVIATSVPYSKRDTSDNAEPVQSF